VSNMKTEIIPEFPNEINSNPVVAIDLLMRDGVVLRFKLPAVQQSRVMWAMGALHASLDVDLDLELPRIRTSYQSGTEDFFDAENK